MYKELCRYKFAHVYTDCGLSENKGGGEYCCGRFLFPNTSNLPRVVWENPFIEPCKTSGLIKVLAPVCSLCELVQVKIQFRSWTFSAIQMHSE